jgi:hypothetical protein
MAVAMDFSALEKAVIRFLLVGEDSTLDILRTQLEHASVASREFSGVGFITRLLIDPGAPVIEEFASFKFSDVEASLPELEHGAGFLLYINQGFLSMLEGYCYDERWPQAVTGFQLAYHSGSTRDLGKSFEKLETATVTGMSCSRHNL